MDVAGVVSELRIYPIKGLCPVFMDSVEVGRNGIKYDRYFCMISVKDGRYVNGKVNPMVHQVRLRRFRPANLAVVLTSPTSQGEFELADAGQRRLAELWLSEQLGVELHLRRHDEGEPGFTDDPRFEGPTVVSQASLEAVARWASPVVSSPSECADRFRPNIVVAGVPAWWEDGLVTEDDSEGRVVRLGEAVELVGVYPVHRCVVPSRAPSTCPAAIAGTATPSFIDLFQAKRRESFADWAPRGRLTGARSLSAYHLATATITTSKAGVIRVGDRVQAGELVSIRATVLASKPDGLTSGAIARLVERAFLIGDLPKKEKYLANLLIAALPAPIATHLLAGKRVPDTVRKPSSVELAVSLAFAAAACAGILAIFVRNK